MGERDRIVQTDRGPRVGAERPNPAAATPSARVLRLQRQIGNSATHRALTRDTIQMPPEKISGTQLPVEKAVGGLQQLRGVGVDPNAISLTRDAETIRRNSPVGSQPLPFKGSDAWDAQTILTNLGQYDVNAATDSDALRCVQAAALASRIVRGPAAVQGLLGSVVLEGMLGTSMGARQRTAIAVLRYVKGRIASAQATYDDLSWAQEAMHDLFYDDVSGTPLKDIVQRVASTMDFSFTVTSSATWLATPEAVIAAAGALKPGEQLLLNTWEVFFNQAFEDLEDQKIRVPVGGSQEVTIGGRTVRLRRIDASRKPAASAINPDRDHMHGHQLLIINDPAVGGLRLYEPEVTDSGHHLEQLTADVLKPYFRDLPDIQTYSYMEILGKLSPLL
jgi:hypothetical protein